MSDNGDVGDTKVAAWTDAAKFQFLLRIVAIMREDGRPIPWSKINMPGRTTKSLQNMWTKIQKEAAALDDGEGTPVATPRKSTLKARGKRAALQGSDAEDDAGSTAATPKKRAAGRKTPKSAKKAKKEDSDSEADGVKKEEQVDEI